MSYPVFRRRKKVINPRYQLQSAFSWAISLFVYSLILGFIIFYPLSQELYFAVTAAEKARISELIMTLHKRIWPAVFMVSVLVWLQVILVSHRVAGPVYRLEKDVEELLNGNFSGRMKLRRSDQFANELERTFNGLAGYLEEAKKGDERLHADIRAKLEAVQSSLKTMDRGALEEAQKTLSGIVRELKTHLDAFTAATRRG